MKVLMYENRKQEAVFWDASTPEKEAAALKCLFKFLDETWEVYGDLKVPADLGRISEIDQEIKSIESAAADKSILLPKSMLDGGKARLDALKRERRHVSANAERELYEKAKAGDSKSVLKLLTMHKGYEYENWNFIFIQDPLAEK